MGNENIAQDNLNETKKFNKKYIGLTIAAFAISLAHIIFYMSFESYKYYKEQHESVKIFINSDYSFKVDIDYYKLSELLFYGFTTLDKYDFFIWKEVRFAVVNTSNNPIITLGFKITDADGMSMSNAHIDHKDMVYERILANDAAIHHIDLCVPTYFPEYEEMNDYIVKFVKERFVDYVNNELIVSDEDYDYDSLMNCINDIFTHALLNYYKEKEIPIVFYYELETVNNVYHEEIVIENLLVYT
ncbi:MAG: hypothetical protein FWE74_03805 [Oscillospiraceae bacterium]|nr:hypothetical protein [Oscillospiraceae bacterium]